MTYLRDAPRIFLHPPTHPPTHPPAQVRLRDPKEWGGGLEIVALANALERPIFLYELKPVGLLFWSKYVKVYAACLLPPLPPPFPSHKKHSPA